MQQPGTLFTLLAKDLRLFLSKGSTGYSVLSLSWRKLGSTTHQALRQQNVSELMSSWWSMRKVWPRSVIRTGEDDLGHKGIWSSSLLSIFLHAPFISSLWLIPLTFPAHSILSLRFPHLRHFPPSLEAGGTKVESRLGTMFYYSSLISDSGSLVPLSLGPCCFLCYCRPLCPITRLYSRRWLERAQHRADWHCLGDWSALWPPQIRADWFVFVSDALTWSWMPRFLSITVSRSSSSTSA